jgi:hypothetical protein
LVTFLASSALIRGLTSSTYRVVARDMADHTNVKRKDPDMMPCSPAPMWPPLR